MLAELPRGAAIDRFIVTDLLGEGAFAAVYRAHDPNLNREVAIKLLSIDCSAGQAWERFKRESQILSRLVHDDIVRVHAVGSWQGTNPYIVMEVVSGHSLEHVLLREQRLPVERALKLCSRIARAMHFAHESGIIHRDLKPSNIMIDASDEDRTEEDRIKILDFGLSKLMHSDQTTLTEPGSVVGSVDYMSPEQWTGQRVDARSDVYSLGCILYECLTGKPPFEADIIIAAMDKHLREVPKLPSRRCNDSRLAIADRICAQALSEKPERRFRTMEDFAVACDRALAETALPSWRRGRLTISIGIAAAVLLALVLYINAGIPGAAEPLA